MKLRVCLGLWFALLSLILADYVLWYTHSQNIDSFLLNFATELAGISITVVVVDYFMEIRNRSDEAVRIAREALHELDHLVWVWQGGKREFYLPELIQLIRGILDEDPMPMFTHNLILNLGSRSSLTLEFNGDIVDSNKKLKLGLMELAKLQQIRDTHDVMKPTEIATHFSIAVKDLMSAAKYYDSQETYSSIQIKEVSETAQEWRYYGRTQEPSLKRLY